MNKITSAQRSLIITLNDDQSKRSLAVVTFTCLQQHPYKEITSKPTYGAGVWFGQREA